MEHEQIASLRRRLVSGIADDAWRHGECLAILDAHDELSRENANLRRWEADNEARRTNERAIMVDEIAARQRAEGEVANLRRQLAAKEEEIQRLQSSPAPYGQPIVAEAFADNGAHSHWYLIDAKTGDKLWSEDPEECAARGFAVSSPAPVVGGVLPAEVPEEALNFIADDVRFIWDPWSEEHDVAVRLYHEWLVKHCASRLSSIKPGEVDALDALRAIWPFVEEDDGGFATKQYQAAIDKVRAVLDAQATTSEGGTK